MPVKYNLDFQLTQNDARRIASDALRLYCNRRYAYGLANITICRRANLDQSIADALEELFAEKFERELDVDFGPNCRIMLIVAAYRYFEERRKSGKYQHEAERDFGIACSYQVEMLAEQMREILEAKKDSDLYGTEPLDENGDYVEYELAEDVEHAWFEGDWKEFDYWDKNFDGVAAFAVVALSE